MGNIAREPDRLVDGKVLIGGELYEKNDRFESLNPATGRPIGSAPLCNREDVALAVEAARTAQPAWAALSIQKRFGYLEVLRNLVREEGDAIASLVTQENGKPLQEAHFVEVHGVLDFMTGLIGKGPSYLKDRSVRPTNPLLWTKRHTIRRVPVGVVGVISPWNLPFAIPMGQILPALAAGNTVVFKPSELTPLVGIKIAGLFRKAGFPPGVFNCITGDRETGAFLVDGAIDGVLFTGSTAAGLSIQERISRRMMVSEMELGGKDAFLLLPDANLERSVNGAVWGGCFGTGQACSSSERFFVPERIAERFVSEVTAHVSAMRTGNGMEDDVDMGPLVSEAQRAKVETQVQDAVSRGARVTCGGKRIDGPGFFFEPTVLADVPLDCALMRDETFGPVIPIAAYKTLDEAVAWCNDSPYGLSATIWTSDVENGMRLARRLEAGSVWINDTSYTHGQAQCPWGGVKSSGKGRSHWLGSLHELTTPQLIGVDSGRRARELWWFPYGRSGLDLARNYRMVRSEGVLAKLLHLGPLIRDFLKTRSLR